MSVEESLKHIPKEGLLKITRSRQSSIEGSQRAALIRKGNELFNAGDIDQAKRIFIATGYGDGLTRIGDYHYSKEAPLEALRMYWLAPSPKKIEHMMERITAIVQKWLSEEGKGKNEQRPD